MLLRLWSVDCFRRCLNIKWFCVLDYICEFQWKEETLIMFSFLSFGFKAHLHQIYKVIIKNNSDDDTLSYYYFFIIIHWGERKCIDDFHMYGVHKICLVGSYRSLLFLLQFYWTSEACFCFFVSILLPFMSLCYVPKKIFLRWCTNKTLHEISSAKNSKENSHKLIPFSFFPLNEKFRNIGWNLSREDYITRARRPRKRSSACLTRGWWRWWVRINSYNTFESR